MKINLINKLLTVSLSLLIAESAFAYCKHESQLTQRLLDAAEKRVHDVDLRGDYRTQALVILQSAKTKFTIINQDRQEELVCKDLYPAVAKELMGLDKVIHLAKKEQRKALKKATG